jgi:pimeloyl-ACP methyl ester carboxylesterase
VVLLHGYLDSHVSFFRLFESLGARHRLFVPEQRGHGDSPAAEDYSIAAFTADAIAFIETLDTGPVHLGGHSLGGIVAQRVAAARPERVRSLALISTVRHAAGNPALLEAAPALAHVSDPVPMALAREFQGSTTFAALPEAIFATYLAATAKVKAAAWRGALHGLLDEPVPREATSMLPTLILWGREDGIFSAADQAALRAHFTTSEFIEYPETGHAPNWERPEAVAQALLKFWQKIESETP